MGCPPPPHRPSSAHTHTHTSRKPHEQPSTHVDELSLTRLLWDGGHFELLVCLGPVWVSQPGVYSLQRDAALPSLFLGLAVFVGALADTKAALLTLHWVNGSLKTGADGESKSSELRSRRWSKLHWLNMEVVLFIGCCCCFFPTLWTMQRGSFSVKFPLKSTKTRGGTPVCLQGQQVKPDSVQNCGQKTISSSRLSFVFFL